MDDRRVWMWIGGAFALVVVVGAVGYFIGRDSSRDPAPQAASPITIDLGDDPGAASANSEPAGRGRGGGGGNADGAKASKGAGQSNSPAPAGDTPGHDLIQIDHGRMALRAQPGGRTLRRLGPTTEFGGPRVMWVAEREGPWLGVVTPELGNDRIGWLRSDPSQLRYGATQYSLDVDLSGRLIEVHKAGQVVGRVVVSVGRIGSNTPAGRFAVTDHITRGLDDVYGCCAIALSAHQPSLPAGWIGGNRIAIHGWSGSVGDSASGGCLRASNRDMKWLMRHVPLGTPVFVRA